MVILGPPQKTPEGIAELSARSRGLTQRHRTLLLLIDGQRSLDQVLSLAHQAGVPRAYMDELVALGLVVPPAGTPPPFTVTPPPPTPAPVAVEPPPVEPAPHLARMEHPLLSSLPPPPLPPLPIDIELGNDFVVLPPAIVARQVPPPYIQENPDEDLPRVGIVNDADPWDDHDTFGLPLSTSELSALDSSDQSLAEARHVLLQALRQEAPVSGAVTMLRVRRARNREALVALLPEVEQKIGHQRHLSDAARILRRVQELLAI